MSDVSAWSPVDESNTAAPPNGWPEFMMPSGVNNCGRMMMGAVRRMYDQQLDGSLVLPYLKLAGGGTVTGSVQVTGQMQASSVVATTVYASSNINTPGGIQAGGNINGSLDIVSARNMGAANVYASGELSAGGRVTAASYDLSGVRFAVRGGGQVDVSDGSGAAVLSLSNDGNIWYQNTTHRFRSRGNAAAFAIIDAGGLTINTGHLVLTSGGSISGAVNGVFSGNLSASNDVTAGGHVYGGVVQSAAQIYAYNDAGFGFGNDGLNKYMMFQSDGWRLNWQIGTGHCWWQKTGGTQLWLMYGDGLCRAMINAVWGYGDYYNTSDLRTKDESTITPATHGLADVLQLNPVHFKRLPTPDDDGPERLLETGFVAQDVAAVFPTAVREVDGIMGVATTPILAAMVVAMRELDDRLKALETGGKSDV